MTQLLGLPELQQKTLRGRSFSFEVAANDLPSSLPFVSIADAITVGGTDGPGEVLRLRTEGRFPDLPVLFDGEGYKGRLAGKERSWMESQTAASADRILTPGTWAAPDTDSLLNAVETESKWAALSGGATVLIAVDHRWLTKKSGELVRILKSLDVPVALVLGNPGDPLSATGAINGLVAAARCLPNLSLLRCDHGAIGALAFGAQHAAIGVRTTHRHFVPPSSGGGGIPNDRSARVFVRDLMDWFTAAKIAGWSTTKVPLRCDAPCCDGQRIDRFLDSQLSVDEHNLTTLAAVANFVLDAPDDQIRRVWGQLCSKATGLYGPMGNLVNEIEPKAQLLQWSTYA